MGLAANVVGILLLATSPVLAQNLVANPDFDLGLEPWEVASPVTDAEWAPELNASGGPGSGAAQVVNRNVDGIYVARLWQCVRVRPGGSYAIGGWLRTPAAERSAEGGATVQGFWYTSLHCTGSTGVAIGAGGVVDYAEDWVFVSEEGWIAPPDARTCAVVPTVRKFEDTGSFVAYFDGIELVPEAPAGALGATATAALALQRCALSRRRARSRPR